MSPRLGALATSLASSVTRSPSPRRPPVKLDLARSLSPRPAPPPTELPNRYGRPGAASPPRERPDGDGANLSPKGSPKEVKDERSDSGSSGGNNNPGSTKSSPEPVVDVKPQFVRHPTICSFGADSITNHIGAQILRILLVFAEE